MTSLPSDDVIVELDACMALRKVTFDASVSTLMVVVRPNEAGKSTLFTSGD